MATGSPVNHKKARAFINNKVKARSMPHPNEVPCVGCGHVWKKGGRRHEYDHTHDYDDPKNWPLVESVCTKCHHARTKKRDGQQPELRPSQVRTEAGTFAPGVSGNPGGQSKEKRQFLERLRAQENVDKVWEAFAALIELRNPQAVLRGVEYLVGKPPETLKLTGHDGGPVKGELTHAAAPPPPNPYRFANIARVLQEAGVFELAALEAKKLEAKTEAAATVERKPDES